MAVQVLNPASRFLVAKFRNQFGVFFFCQFDEIPVREFRVCGFSRFFRESPEPYTCIELS